MKYLLFLILFACLITQAAETTNSHSTFVLNGFTFERPGRWEWEELKPQKDPTVALLLRNNKTSEAARVVMIHYPPTAGLGKRDAALKRWQNAFLTGNLQTNQTTIAGHTITCAEINGTHKGEKVTGPLPDFALVGMVVEDASGNVVIKITGPATVVKKSQSELKKMVEEAVKSRDARKAPDETGAGK